MWQRIPKEVKDELELIRKHTRKTGREASITFCKKKDKERLFVGNDFKGNTSSTEIGDCSHDYGVSYRVGDAHSHPEDTLTIGNVHSEHDLAVNMETSLEQKRPQISCVTTPSGNITPCIEPKAVPTRRKVNRYKRAANDNRLISPYVVDNVNNDFHIELFDSKSGRRIQKPQPKRVIKNAFGKSTRGLRKNVKAMKRGPFCDFIQQMTVHNNNKIADECKAELKRKGILDYLGVD